MAVPEAIFFLDSEIERPQGTKSTQRPWTAFWPPRVGEPLYNWLSSECPEALTWRFNPERPFDRPWQRWTKLARTRPSSFPKWELPAQLEPNDQFDINIQQSEADENLEQARKAQVSALDSYIEVLKLSSTVPLEFMYLAPLDVYQVQKPYHSRLPFLNGLRRTNIMGKAYRDVRVYDVTGSTSSFDLDDSGFEFLKIPAGIKDWSDHQVREQYLPNMKKWLLNHFNCEAAHVYAYNFRCKDVERTSTENWIAPYMRAHCDVTDQSALSRLKQHLPHVAAEAEKKRYRYVDIWRPLTTPEQDCPLAVCDFRSLSQSDLVRADVVFPHHCDEAYELKYSPYHRWFYEKGMGEDDVILFKLYDNKDGVATLCPHSAFVDPKAAPDTPKRASVEMRAILLG